MTALIWLYSLAALLAAALLVIASLAVSLADSRRHEAYLEGWITDHFTGSGVSPYDSERKWDTREARP